MNKILVPIREKSVVPQMIAAGADEFYIGFHDDFWHDKTDEYAEINRMSGFGKIANPYTLDEVLKIAEDVAKQGRKLFVTINSSSYSERKLELIDNYLDKITNTAVSGVIVSTPELVKMAEKKKIKSVASTMCGIFNSDIVKIYQNMGLQRLILPRDLSLSEIEGIVTANPNIEYEVFLMRNGCQFSDSHCLGFHHRDFGSICGALNHGKVSIFDKQTDFANQHETELNNLLYREGLHRHAACGLCALYRLVKMNISAYKIVGRAEPVANILHEIHVSKKNIEIALSSSCEEEFLKNMILPDNKIYACKMGLGCYYPEVRF